MPNRSLQARLVRHAACVAASLALSAGTTASAAIYAWDGGAVTTTWTDANNWNPNGTVAPLGVTEANRLNVSSTQKVIYNYTLAPTVYTGDPTPTTGGGRGLVIGSGANARGEMEIAAGTFSTLGAASGDVIGNGSGAIGTLTVNGGTFIGTAAGTGVGIGGGPTSTLNVQAGTATIATLTLNATTATVNLSGTGVLEVNNIARGGGTAATINFDGGTLRARTNTTGFLTGLDSATINAGGVTIDTASSDVTIAQALLAGAGSGGITKTGIGTLTLSGANTFSGTTTIHDGTLSLGGSGQLQGGTYAAAIVNQGRLSIGTSANQTLTGTISGVGELFKAGNGTLTLTGSNTFTGNVAISLGTLVINNSNALGVGPKTVSINAANVDKTLVLDTSLAGGSDITLASDISFQTSAVNGAFRNVAGSNRIDGAITMTVNNGNTRVISDGGTLTLAGNITANAVTRVLDLSGSSTGDNTFSGVLNNTNTPALTKTGSGKWILFGANTYTGGTTIQDGSLVLGGGDNRLATTGTVTLGDTSTSGKLVLGDGTARNQTLAGLTTTGLGGSVVGGAATTSTLTLSFASGTNTFAGTLGGAGPNENNLALTKSGAGTLVLSGSNSYAGATTVSAGIVAIGNQNALNGTSAISVATGGATLRLDVPDATSTTVGAGKSVSIAGNGASNFGALQGAASANVTWAGNVVLAANAISRLGGGDSGTLTVSGVISGADANAGVLVSRAPNSTTILGNVNTYTGDTQLFPNGSTVTLKMGIADAISSQSRLMISSATSGTAYFDLNGYNQNIRALSDTVTGDLVVTNSSMSSDAELTLSVTDSQIFGGSIQDGASRKISIVKQGAGTQTFSNPNTYSGDTTVSAGTLTLAHSLALQNSTLRGAVVFDSTVASNGFTLGGLGGASSLALQNNAGTPAAVSLNVGSNNASTTYSGALSGAGSLTKIGDGALTLSGSSTYTGATSINAGTLLVNGSLASASAVSVASGATLGGSGTVGGPTSILGGGILSPGTSPGTLTVNNTLALADTSILSFEINPTDQTIGGGINDLINGVTDLTLGGTLNLSGSGSFTSVTPGTIWRLINYSGSLTLGTLTIGTAPTLADGYSFNVDTSSGGQVNLVVVPEPAGPILFAGLGFAAACWLALRRRR